jgi:hypothetical protein
MPGSGTPLAVEVWDGRLFWSAIGRPGQRLCTTAHALEPHMAPAEAGTLHMTAATVATLAIPAIIVIFFIADPSNDLSLNSVAGFSLPHPVISLVGSCV